jgi:hypothetical protein
MPCAIISLNLSLVAMRKRVQRETSIDILTNQSKHAGKAQVIEDWWGCRQYFLEDLSAHQDAR